MSSFYVHNFGCRATQSDGAALERDLLGRGLSRAPSAREAEVVVLNTCTVTAEADRDVRAAIRRAHRENPGCRILVTGCYAQRAPQELYGLPGVAWVVGNSHKHRVGEILHNDCHPERARRFFGARVEGPLFPAEALASTYVGDIFAHTELMAAPVFDGLGYDKTRPNLKVQDGCDNRCSFCIIPFVRGQSRSLRRDDVLREMDALVAAGFREVVISGINLGRWGRDLEPASRFEDLVRAILAYTGVERLRLSSIEPMDWTDELIELVAGSPRIAQHAHVPLQTGSDRILRRMHRKYRPWHYEERIRKIRAAMPAAAIGADVMTGFPGETERRVRGESAVHRLATLHLPARVHLLGAPGHARDGYAGPVASRDQARAQSHTAGVGGGKEEGIHAVSRRASGLYHYVKRGRRRPHRNPDRQLSEAMAGGRARGESDCRGTGARDF